MALTPSGTTLWPLRGRPKDRVYGETSNFLLAGCQVILIFLDVTPMYTMLVSKKVGNNDKTCNILKVSIQVSRSTLVTYSKFSGHWVEN